jgi:hypothetical protein
MEKVDMSKRIVTKEFRVSFPSVFKATAFEGQEPKFSVTMLFPKDTDISDLKKAADEAAKEKWGDKIPKNLRMPFVDGDEKEYDGYAGMVAIKANTKTKPQVVDRSKQPLLDDSEFYGGCYARASVVAFAYDTAGNKGVSFALNNVQKLRDGEPFGSRTNADSDFDDLDDDDMDL